MVGAGTNFPVADFSIAMRTDFVTAFISVTNPVFAYAGHFMFFILISEMKHPEHAMRAAWVLQTFATVFYVIFAAVLYLYVGSAVASPAFSSLPDKWQKAAYGIAIPNFLIAGSLYSHTAAKLLFVRFFRTSKHLYRYVFPRSIFISSDQIFSLETCLGTFRPVDVFQGSLFLLK